MKSRMKYGLYFCISCAMLLYAVPRLTMGDGGTLASAFGVVWIGFALLVMAAQLHQWLGVDEETARRLADIKKERRRRMQGLFTGSGHNERRAGRM